MNYFLFTYGLNAVGSYIVWRTFVCYFINRFPGTHRNNYKDLLIKDPLPIVLVTFLTPIPFVGFITAMIIMSNGFHFRYYKPKVVLTIRHGKIDFCNVPKYLNPKNQSKYLYSYDELYNHKYNPTPRMIKARSGKFTPTER